MVLHVRLYQSVTGDKLGVVSKLRCKRVKKVYLGDIIM